MAKKEEERAPCIAILREYVAFRMGLKDRMLLNEAGYYTQAEFVSCVQLMGDYSHTTMSMFCWGDAKDPAPATKGANLLVDEVYQSGAISIKVCLGKDRMLEELHLTGETLAAYFQRLYDFLTTGAWD